VFTFLVILVLSMTLLEKLVAVLPGAPAPEEPADDGGDGPVGAASSGSPAGDPALVAAAMAAIQRHKQRN